MTSGTDSRLLVMEAIQRAIAATGSGAGQSGWDVCVRDPEGEDLISFKLGSYKEVQALAADIRKLGYDLTMLHPVHTECDFVLEPHKAAGSPA